MLKTIAAIIGMIPAVAVAAVAREEISGPVTAEILRVIDGDTLLARHNLGRNRKWRFMSASAA